MLFFYSALFYRVVRCCPKSLPCSLWFFDKGKGEDIKDKVLFIDARNYYTVVDRTLNEWSEWQLKNLNAIVWLYRGENEKYQDLLIEYRNVLGRAKPFEEILALLKDELKDLQKRAKLETEHAARNDKKRVQAYYDTANFYSHLDYTAKLASADAISKALEK